METSQVMTEATGGLEWAGGFSETAPEISIDLIRVRRAKKDRNFRRYCGHRNNRTPHEARMCGVKKRYVTPEMAQAFATVMDQKHPEKAPFSAYPCPYCKFYHIGGKKPEAEGKNG